MSAVDLHRLSLPPPYGRTSRALLAFRHIRRFSRFPASRLPARRDCIMRLGLNTSQHSYELGKRSIAAGQMREKYFENFFARLAPSRHNRRSRRTGDRPAAPSSAPGRTGGSAARTIEPRRRETSPCAAHAPHARHQHAHAAPSRPRPAARPRRPSDRAARPARPRRARAQPPAVGARGRDEGVPCSGRPPSPL